MLFLLEVRGVIVIVLFIFIDDYVFVFILIAIIVLCLSIGGILAICWWVLEEGLLLLIDEVGFKYELIVIIRIIERVLLVMSGVDIAIDSWTPNLRDSVINANIVRYNPIVTAEVVVAASSLD